VTAHNVTAMHARYDGYCAMAGCTATIPRGHILYRIDGHTACYACGRRYVDALPREPRPRPLPGPDGPTEKAPSSA
jgi:hypothetical protein